MQRLTASLAPVVSSIISGSAGKPSRRSMYEAICCRTTSSPSDSVYDPAEFPATLHGARRMNPSIHSNGPGGGGCAIKAEGVCRLVLPGVRTCAPFKEGIVHSWIGGLGAHPLGWG